MKILIVDDHRLFRDGLKRLLSEIDAHTATVEANDLDSALEAVRKHADFDLVLFDLGLPGASGVSALARFRDAHPVLPVVVLSGLSDRRTVIEALDQGAMGFIPKTASTDTFAQALQTVLSNRVYVPGNAHEGNGPEDPAPHAPQQSLSALKLTQRQLEVFKLIVRGRPNKLIARDLDISESTVKAHVKPILKALNVTSRVGAILEVGRLKIALD